MRAQVFRSCKYIELRTSINSNQLLRGYVSLEPILTDGDYVVVWILKSSNREKSFFFFNPFAQLPKKKCLVHSPKACAWPSSPVSNTSTGTDAKQHNPGASSKVCSSALGGKAEVRALDKGRSYFPGTECDNPSI